MKKRKTRLVAKEYVQKYSKDFFETISHVVRFETVKLILILATHKKWKYFNLM